MRVAAFCRALPGAPPTAERRLIFCLRVTAAEAGFSLTGSVAQPALPVVAQTDGLSDRSEGGFMNRAGQVDALKWSVGSVNSGRGQGSACPVPC